MLGVIALELLWLRRQGWSIATAALRLAPGMLMLFALRAALTGLDWPWVAVPLIVSLPVHLADLARTARG
ncbi:hypothetical protein [Sphingomonas sp. CFBP 13714]|uniref:hypothetical protein n=1 Tax=Sphingomonas sp. CFBP 13714 TaxID=2775308 RepID=UPI0031453437